jgi:hypothetical protein
MSGYVWLECLGERNVFPKIGDRNRICYQDSNRIRRRGKICYQNQESERSGHEGCIGRLKMETRICYEIRKFVIRRIYQASQNSGFLIIDFRDLLSDQKIRYEDV